MSKRIGVGVVMGVLAVALLSYRAEVKGADFLPYMPPLGEDFRVTSGFVNTEMDGTHTGDGTNNSPTSSATSSGTGDCHTCAAAAAGGAYGLKRMAWARILCVDTRYRVEAFPLEDGLMKLTLARTDLRGAGGLGFGWGNTVPYIITLQGGMGPVNLPQVHLSGRATELFTMSGAVGSRVGSSHSKSSKVDFREDSEDKFIYSFRQGGGLHQYEFDYDPATDGQGACMAYVDSAGRRTEIKYAQMWASGSENWGAQPVQIRRMEVDAGVCTEVRIKYGETVADPGFGYVKWAVLRRATAADVGQDWDVDWGRGQDPGYGDDEWGDDYNIRRVRYYYYQDGIDLPPIPVPM